MDCSLAHCRDFISDVERANKYHKLRCYARTRRVSVASLNQDMVKLELGSLLCRNKFNILKDDKRVCFYKKNSAFRAPPSFEVIPVPTSTKFEGLHLAQQIGINKSVARRQKSKKPRGGVEKKFVNRQISKQSGISKIDNILFS